ncbi:MAG: phosphoribosylformylglycinamidine cyclo-ligase [Saprospirales bacterium]|nr:phosphoribosylformylglycinamidine cyclo-ligase [Saprospirales bacterium]MBK8922875.1 phosphoribosylformylglycinamidine cyclo-ligase [Saprospirales bacterium]
MTVRQSFGPGRNNQHKPFHAHRTNSSILEDSELKYDQRGVSATKLEVHAAIQHLDKGLYPNAFCKILPDIAAGDPEYCNILHADTAGTKTSLAYVYWKETGDLSVWAGVAQDAIVMNLDDMACVGCTGSILLSSTIGRNKNLIPGEVIAAVIRGTSDFIDTMRAQGIDLHLAGGETADVGDIVRTIDVGFTAFARMKRSDVLVSRIQDGDVIVGLASFGKAIYEPEYNGGMGSNGLTAARHDVLANSYAVKYPESYDPHVPAGLVYSGHRQLTETLPVDGRDIPVGKLILSPTRTFLPVLQQVFARHRQNLHGVIHCTGGGQTKVLKFIQDVHVVKDNLFELPLLFKLIQESSGASWREMYQVFNMGHRMELYLPRQIAADVIGIAAGLGVDARVIGHVEAGAGAAVTLKSEFGTFQYS